ncbi:MAG: T9SS type A sorting domain-containing protein [Bacteroidetes bacterium]|nr:T9SS type A sorting domain-containing protein [Bacteroidota bacterium]
MLPSSGEVKFYIMNLYGQTLYSFNQKPDAGRHMLNLDLYDFSPGIYYYTLEFKGKRLIKKMVINK